MSDVTVEPEEPKLADKVVRSAKWALVDSFGNKLLSLVTFTILARLLQPSQFGLLTTSVVVLTLLSVIVDSGMAAAIIRMQKLDIRYAHTAFWMSTCLGVALALGCVALAPVIAQLFDNPDLTNVLRWMSIFLVMQGLSSTPLAILQRELQFQKSTKVRLIAAVAGATTGVVWAIISPTVWALVAQFLVSATVLALLLLAFGTYRPRFEFHRSIAPELLGFGSTMLGIRLTSFLNDHGDNFTVGLRLGATNLGYYAVGYRIFRILMDSIAGAISPVTLPMFSKLQHEPKRLASAYLRTAAISISLSIPLFISVGVCADYLIPTVFGAQWQSSVPVMQIFSVYGLLNAAIFFDGFALMAVGRIRTEFWLSLVMCIGNMAAFGIGSFWGISGVAVAATVWLYVMWPFRVWMVRRHLGVGVREYLSRWVGPAVSGFAMTAVMLLIRTFGDAFLPVLGAVIAGALTYATLLRLTAPGTFRELITVTRTATRRS